MSHLHDPVDTHAYRHEHTDHRRMVHYIEKTGFLEVRDFWLEIVFGDLHGNRTLQVASPRFFTLPKALVPTGVASTTAAGTPRLNLRLAAAGAPTNFMAGSPSVT